MSAECNCSFIYRMRPMYVYAGQVSRIFHLRYRLLQSRNKNGARQPDYVQYFMKFCRRNDPQYRRAFYFYSCDVLKYYGGVLCV